MKTKKILISLAVLSSLALGSCAGLEDYINSNSSSSSRSSDDNSKTSENSNSTKYREDDNESSRGSDKKSSRTSTKEDKDGGLSSNAQAGEGDKKVGPTDKDIADPFSGREIIEDAPTCTSSGKREANVAVDIGEGDRQYWGFTNENKQLVYVIADKITLQNPKKEKLTKEGRYCPSSKMAKVDGYGAKYNRDRGHAIADSLGGMSNAYNLTPQDADVNRNGDQAYFEKAIRQAGGAENFRYKIYYPDAETNVPSWYELTYEIDGQEYHESFPNMDPEKYNEQNGVYDK